MVEIKIHSKAAQYIKAKGGVIHLAYSTKGGGCCGSSGLLIPDIFLGSPKGDIGSYHDMQVDGVLVFVHKEILKESSNLKISLDSLLVFKKLTVTGIDPKGKVI